MSLKHLVVAAVVVGVLAALLSSSVLAAPTTPQPQNGATPAPGTCPACGLQSGQDGQLGPVGGMMGRGVGAGMGGWGWLGWAGSQDEVTGILGMTSEQIQSERLAGKSLSQIAQEKGVNKDKLLSAILASKKAELDKAVAGKQLTQAQADAMYQRIQTVVPLMVDNTAAAPMMRGGAGCPMRDGSGGNSTGVVPRMRFGPRSNQS